MRGAEEIENSIKNLRQTTSAETDERILKDAVEALSETAGPRPGGIGRRIKSTMAVLAVAVVIIAGLIAVEMFRSPEQQAEKPVAEQRQVGDKQIVVKAVNEPVPILDKTPDMQKIVTEFESELKRAEQMFVARDVNGLMAMLSEGQVFSRLIAANFLAKVGDMRAVELLEKLSAEWKGDKTNNPFAKAAEEIKGRLRQKETQPAGDSKKKLGTTVKVVTKNGRRYIHGWLIDANDNPVRGEVWLGGSKVKTTDEGAFTIAEPTYTEFGSVFGRAFNAERDMGSFFIWERSDDINDAEIVVEPLASASGFVVDKKDEQVDDFELTISVYVNNDIVYKGNIGDTPWKLRINPDSSFDINSIPTGVALQLAVKKPGFKTPVKLQGLTGGRNLDLGRIVLEPIEGFDEDTKWDCTLAGIVIDENNEPMAGARIGCIVAEERFDTETDANGWYEFKALPQDVEMTMVSFTTGYGNNTFAYTCIEPNSEMDIRMFPPAYDWYDKPAPGLFVSKWLNTDPITLEELKGQVVILHIGIDLSGYPRQTKQLAYLQYLEQIKGILEKYKESPLTVIAIHKHLQQLELKEDNLRQFVKEYGINFPFGIDREAEAVKAFTLPLERLRAEGAVNVPRKGLRSEGAMYSLYEVKAEPAYYLIDKNGILRTSATQSNLEEWIEYILGK